MADKRHREHERYKELEIITEEVRVPEEPGRPEYLVFFLIRQVRRLQLAQVDKTEGVAEIDLRYDYGGLQYEPHGKGAHHYLHLFHRVYVIYEVKIGQDHLYHHRDLDIGTVEPDRVDHREDIRGYHDHHHEHQRGHPDGLAPLLVMRHPDYPETVQYGEEDVGGEEREDVAKRRYGVIYPEYRLVDVDGQEEYVKYQVIQLLVMEEKREYQDKYARADRKHETKGQEPGYRGQRPYRRANQQREDYIPETVVLLLKHACI